VKRLSLLTGFKPFIENEGMAWGTEIRTYGKLFLTLFRFVLWVELDIAMGCYNA
jgi:hypothetical protein